MANVSSLEERGIWYTVKEGKAASPNRCLKLTSPLPVNVQKEEEMCSMAAVAPLYPGSKSNKVYKIIVRASQLRIISLSNLIVTFSGPVCLAHHHAL